MTITKPTTILTGFLGAGKTTFLNHLLESKPDTKFAIIENEFGKQSIDSDLILRAEGEVVELNNGCLCCTLNEELYDLLNALYERRDEYDELIIEATGVADPTGLAEPFIVHPAIKKTFPLRTIICLVDAELVDLHLQETEEAINQITYSDVLLINKTDLVEEEYLNQLKIRLQKLNPLAKIVAGNKATFPPIEHLLQGVPTFNKPPAPAEQPAAHNHRHTAAIVSHLFEFDRPFIGQTLYQQLFVFLTFQAQGLYRMKGLIWLQDSDQRILIQSVGKRLNMSEYAPWQPGEKRGSTIVFIGKQLKREGLQKLLDRCLHTG